MLKNLILIGASSEIAQQVIYESRNKNLEVFKISKSISDDKTLHVDDYLQNSDKIIDFINNIKDPYVIFFNGYLKENRPLQSPDLEEINNTININFVIPYILSEKIISNTNYKKLIYISTVAAIKPRYKNYIYGLSKKMLESSIVEFNRKNIAILRFGKVKTKMSETHVDPVFTISSNQAAKVIVNNLDKKAVVYSSFGIRVVSYVLKILPLGLINRIEKFYINE